MERPKFPKQREGSRQAKENRALKSIAGRVAPAAQRKGLTKEKGGRSPAQSPLAGSSLSRNYGERPTWMDTGIRKNIPAVGGGE